MKILPLHHVPQGSLRKSALHDTRVDVNDDLVLPIPGMEMRGNMVIPVHRDDDSKKPADNRHAGSDSLTYYRSTPGRRHGDQTME